MRTGRPPAPRCVPIVDLGSAPTLPFSAGRDEATHCSLRQVRRHPGSRQRGRAHDASTDLRPVASHIWVEDSTRRRRAQRSASGGTTATATQGSCATRGLFNAITIDSANSTMVTTPWTLNARRSEVPWTSTHSGPRSAMMRLRIDTTCNIFFVVVSRTDVRMPRLSRRQIEGFRSVQRSFTPSVRAFYGRGGSHAQATNRRDARDDDRGPPPSHLVERAVGAGPPPARFERLRARRGVRPAPRAGRGSEVPEDRRPQNEGDLEGGGRDLAQEPR